MNLIQQRRNMILIPETGTRIFRLSVTGGAVFYHEEQERKSCMLMMKETNKFILEKKVKSIPSGRVDLPKNQQELKCVINRALLRSSDLTVTFAAMNSRHLRCGNSKSRLSLLMLTDLKAKRRLLMQKITHYNIWMLTFSQQCVG